MLSPRPYGRFSEETDLSSEDSAAIELLARNVTNLKNTSGLQNFKRVIDLSGGRQAVAVDMGGLFRILVIEAYERPDYEFDGRAQAHIPMLFSGVVTRAQVVERDGEGVRLRLTEQTRRRLAQYQRDDDPLPAKEVELQRFVIDYSLSFDYFKPKETGIYKFTQYVKQRPTWYSGAMAEVVQVVGGYGRQDLEELPDLPLERARLAIPKLVMEAIKSELGNSRLPACTGFPDRLGQFQYDYKAFKCHGVSFDPSGAPWLIEVKSGGVYAMPLPVIPGSTTEAFRSFIEDMQDEELLALLDRFGGLPSGESFPVEGGDFQAWRRAGVIIKVCDTADFYSFDPMYTAGGWAFNRNGTEGFNTCWGYDGSQLINVHAYKMRLSLGAAERRGYLSYSWVFESESDQDAVNAYLNGLFSVVDNSERGLAIAYKVRRVSAEEILALARSGRGGESDKDYWDNLELSPIAAHSGRVSRTGSGPIYVLTKKQGTYGGLKFPELTGKGCESFEMASPEYEGPPRRCDTIVFGCYVDDSLKVVKYFFDDRKFYREVTGDFEDVMIVGSWEQVETTGMTGLMGDFYTTDFDDRAEQPPRKITSRLIGKDLGYGNAAYNTPGVLARVGGVTRSRYYTHLLNTKTTNDLSYSVAACVPVFSRDCILYPFTESVSGTSESESYTRRGMTDPNYYQLHCYDDIWHYLGRTQNGNRGEPPSKDGVPVYVDTLIYQPTEYSDYADSGEWLGLPSGGFLDVTGICGPYTSRYSSTAHANGVVIGGEAPAVEEYSWQRTKDGYTEGHLSASLSVALSASVHRNAPSQFYYDFSPQGLDNYFYRDSIRVTFGSMKYASLSEEAIDGRRTRWGHTTLADHQTAHHFIGVINE